ncbi:MAG: aspartate carbamoyltransferase regulatory subunit [Clostridiales bacterium]|nr:aspartate carbamoyltransferase regulatory subunit [Clostridiales bacterium]
MNIDSIQNGVVIDHITAGRGMTLYHMLGLDEIDCPVAIITNAGSKRMGKKDIIKVDADIDINVDVVGYVDPGATVNIIKNSLLIEKFNPALPSILTNVLKCKNPRCVTAVEQEINHIFKLTDKDNRVYRCLYCETKH